MKRKKRILIIDHVHPLLIEGLQMHEVVYIPDVLEEDLEGPLRIAEVLIIRSKLQITAAWIDKAPNLAYIGRLGSGMDNIDTTYAKTLGIVCENAPEGNRNAVAEQTIGMMLSLLSKLPQGSKQIAAGIWDRSANEGEELSEMTVGIIGYGHVGTRVAELLRPFGCNIVAYDRYLSGFGSSEVQETDLDELMAKADIITLHTPLNEYSEGLVNKDFIDRVAKQFYLLNLSRGKVVILSDLINGLESGKIKAIGLDVLPNEKLDTYTAAEKAKLTYLSNSERVMLSPHIGGITKNAYKKLAKVLLEKVTDWINK